MTYSKTKQYKAKQIISDYLMYYMDPIERLRGTVICFCHRTFILSIQENKDEAMFVSLTAENSNFFVANVYCYNIILAS